MNKYLLASCVVLATWLVSANAYSSYLSKLPNGYNAPNPCGSGTWPALGHTDPTSPRGENQFGRDFKSNFNSRTDVLDWQTLCWMDSDGDKSWNGYELGDPYCNGTKVAGMPVSNPAVCEPIDSALCVRINRQYFSICPQNSNPNVADPIGPDINLYNGNNGGNTGGSNGNTGGNNWNNGNGGNGWNNSNNWNGGNNWNNGNGGNGWNNGNGGNGWNNGNNWNGGNNWNNGNGAGNRPDQGGSNGTRKGNVTWVKRNDCVCFCRNDTKDIINMAKEFGDKIDGLLGGTGGYDFSYEEDGDSSEERWTNGNRNNANRWKNWNNGNGGWNSNNDWNSGNRWNNENGNGWNPQNSGNRWNNGMAWNTGNGYGSYNRYRDNGYGNRGNYRRPPGGGGRRQPPRGGPFGKFPGMGGRKDGDLIAKLNSTAEFTNKDQYITKTCICACPK